MNHYTEKRLKEISDAYFGSIPDPDKRFEIERMYQAFKARMILETKVSGGATQGVVYGYLEERKP